MVIGGNRLEAVRKLPSEIRRLQHIADLQLVGRLEMS